MSKFLVDAQLPVRLAFKLREAGFDALHTKDLPQQNATPDSAINDLSVAQKRTVITKDADFVNSFFVQGKPYKLLLITTGNIRNTELESLFTAHLQRLTELLEEHSFVELGRDSIIAHR